MNNLEEDTMKYQGAELGGVRPPIVGMAEARKQSECEAAYQMLHKAQDELSGVLGVLHSRLGPVLNGNAAEADGSPSQPPSSEVHGWLIAAEERTYALTRRVRAMTESLTI